MKNVMTIAWEIAKKGAAKFGGKVKEYFATALKMAWGIVKNEAGAFNTDAVRLAGKNGNGYAVIAIPEEFEVVRVVSGRDKFVPKGKLVKSPEGVGYMVYTVYFGQTFEVETARATYLYKAMENGKLYFNGTK